MLNWIKGQVLGKQIKKRNKYIDREELSSVLVFYDINKFLIGDTLRSVSNLFLVKKFFPASEIDFVARNFKVLELLENYPFISSCSQGDFSDIPIEKYDVILIVSDNETKIFGSLIKKYGSYQYRRPFVTSVYSLTSIADTEENPIRFPIYHELIDYEFSVKDRLKVAKSMIFLSRGEQEWANTFLEEKVLL